MQNLRPIASHRFAILLLIFLPAIAPSPLRAGVDICQGYTKNSKAVVPYSPMAKPPKGTRVNDPDFGTTMVRITDALNDWGSHAAIPVYPTIQAWNADESLFILYVTEGATTEHALFDGRTYEFKWFLDINPADLEQFYWDTVDPDILYYIDNHESGGTYHFELTRMHVLSGTKEILHDFASDMVPGGALSACGSSAERVDGGGDPFFMSYDNDLIGLGCYLGHNGPGGAAAYRAFTYRLSSGTFGDTSATEVESVVPQATPSGALTYFYDDDPTRSFVLDPITNAVVHTVAWKGDDHSDMLLNAAGHDVIVGAQFDGPSGDGNLMWIDLTTGGVAHTILDHPIYDPYPAAGTLVSGRSTLNPGWLAVGITGDIHVTETSLDQEVLLANVDTGDYCRVAHNRSTGNWNNASSSNYWAQPNVTLSPRGTRILVQSDWGAATPGPGVIADPNAVVDTYVIELPSYGSATSPTRPTGLRVN